MSELHVVLKNLRKAYYGRKKNGLKCSHIGMAITAIKSQIKKLEESND